MTDEVPFGEWLRKQRRALDLTRQALANQAGCAEISLRRIENGTLKPSKELADILLEKLGIPEFERPQWILFARGLSSFPTPSVDSLASQSLTNLPSSLTSFIGREKEQAEVIKHIRKYRLVTLTGPGGVGKTRLSIKVGEQVLADYPNGVWLMELASLNDPALLPQTVLALFGIAAQSNTSPIEILINFLRAKTILLILDNCEHLLEACAQLADTLLKNCPNLKILATSRESMGITGEAAYPVPSLGLPDLEQLLEDFRGNESVSLFEERAQLAKMDFSLTIENASSVAQICHRLDGIPLAIELAAAHVHMFSIEQIATRLNESFNLLTGGSRTALPRQQTIRASIDWSWNLLSDSERILLRRLSVFAGGCTLEAAESVCGGKGIESDQISELMPQLLAKSLVVVKQEPRHERRYHLLETIRQYANEKLEVSEKANGSKDRHLDYFLNLAETAAPHLIRSEQLKWLTQLDADYDNLRVALEWALSTESCEPALRLCAALGPFWLIRCYWIEGSKWLERALATPAPEQTTSEKAARARALYHDAEIAQVLDNLDRMEASARASLELCEGGTDRHDLGIAKFYVGFTFFRLEDYEKACPLLEQSLSDFHKSKDFYWEARAQRWFSMGLVQMGQKSLAETIPPDLQLARRVGERLHLASALYRQAMWEWENHQIDNAEVHLKESEMLCDQIGTTNSLASFLQALIAHYYKNDYQQARIMYTKSQAQSELIGGKNAKALVLVNLGILARDEGELQQAQSYIEEALNIARLAGTRSSIGFRLALLAQIEFLQGTLDRSKYNFRESLLIAKQVENSGPLFIFSNSYANMAPQIAVRVLGAAHAYSQKYDEPLDPFFVRDANNTIAQTRHHLDESTFNAAWAEGEKLSLAQALDLALKVVEES